MIFIKKALAQKYESQSLVKLLDTRCSKFEEARSHKVIHISDLSRDHGFCPREYALLDVTGKKPKGQFIGTALRVAFDNGNALSDLCRNKWLVDDIVGDWECLGCGDVATFEKRPKVNCVKCKRDLWRYREPVFVHKASGASGSIDFFIDFGTGKHVAVECKSISKDEFKDLKMPLAEHRLRTKLYLEAIAGSERPEVGKIDLSFGLILYISKGFGAKTDALNGKVVPFREFRVEREAATAEPYFALAAKVKAYRAGGTMPHGICANAMDKRVGSCSMGKECWSGGYPAGV